MEVIKSMDLDPNEMLRRCVLGAATRHSTLLAVACRLNTGLLSSQWFTDSNYSSQT